MSGTTTITPCVIGHTVRGRHLPQCDDTACPGCLPAAASPYAAVCESCELVVRQSLRDLPTLWEDLGLPARRRALGTGDGMPGMGDPEACPDCDAGMPCTRHHRSGYEPLSPARVEARWKIQETAARWCKVLDRELNVRLPQDPPTTVRWMAHHVAVNVGLILASTQHAWALWADLHGFRDEADTWWPGVMDTTRLLDAVGRRGGVRVQCPACGAWVLLHDDDREIRCWGSMLDGTPCQEWGTLDYWRALVVPDADRPMTAVELVDWLWAHHRYRVTPEIIWQWASRGTRYGRLTKVVKVPPLGEHAQGCCDTACTGCLPGPARYDPVRAAQIALAIRAHRAC